MLVLVTQQLVSAPIHPRPITQLVTMETFALKLISVSVALVKDRILSHVLLKINAIMQVLAILPLDTAPTHQRLMELPVTISSFVQITMFVPMESVEEQLTFAHLLHLVQLLVFVCLPMVNVPTLVLFPPQLPLSSVKTLETICHSTLSSSPSQLRT